MPQPLQKRVYQAHQWADGRFTGDVDLLPRQSTTRLFYGTWSHGPIRNAARSWEATAFPVRISNSKGRVVEKAEMFSGFCATSYRVGSLNG